MRLSEAIRLGAMLKPQGSHGLLKDGRSCALGAALDAIGLLNRYGIGGYMPIAVLARFPALQRLVAHPAHVNDFAALEYVIAELNDDHKWTRERIADWVATVEPAETTDLPAIDQADLVTENAGRA